MHTNPSLQPRGSRAKACRSLLQFWVTALLVLAYVHRSPDTALSAPSHRPPSLLSRRPSLFVEVLERLVLLDNIKDASLDSMAQEAAVWLQGRRSGRGHRTPEPLVEGPEGEAAWEAVEQEIWQEEESVAAAQVRRGCGRVGSGCHALSKYHGSRMPAGADPSPPPPLTTLFVQASLALPGCITDAARERLTAVHAGHTALARLVQHALAVASSSVTAAAAGASGGLPFHSSGMATSQEVHAHARALPLLLGCYLGSEGRLQVRRTCVMGTRASGPAHRLEGWHRQGSGVRARQWPHLLSQQHILESQFICTTQHFAPHASACPRREV
jgi:hypothetical protein